MILSIQIKVLFYSFMYGVLYYCSLKFLKYLKCKKVFIYIINIILSILFYYLLYKINNGELSIYIFIFLILGVIFSKVFYFSNKNI